MNSSSLLSQFPSIKFLSGNIFSWSPRQQVVFYDPKQLEAAHGTMALLHEIGHAQLGHQNYNLDMDLINMEVAAWEVARTHAKNLALTIDEEHVDSCLETYRTWLFKRSRCPECRNTGTQQNQRTYYCFLCSSTWEVAQTRSLQPRRMRCVRLGKI